MCPKLTPYCCDGFCCSCQEFKNLSISAVNVDEDCPFGPATKFLQARIFSDKLISQNETSSFRSVPQALEYIADDQLTTTIACDESVATTLEINYALSAKLFLNCDQCLYHPYFPNTIAFFFQTERGCFERVEHPGHECFKITPSQSKHLASVRQRFCASPLPELIKRGPWMYFISMLLQTAVLVLFCGLLFRSKIIARLTSRVRNDNSFFSFWCEHRRM